MNQDRKGLRSGIDVMTKMKPPNPPRRHHFVPQFFLEAWANAEGKIAAYKKLPNGDVALSWRSPKSVGYREHLYSFPELGEAAVALETGLLKRLDDRAAKIIQRMIHSTGELEIDDMVWWSHFLLSLIVRNPESVTALKRAALEMWTAPDPKSQADYEARKGPDDPATLDEWLQSDSGIGGPRLGQTLLHSLITNKNVAGQLRQMSWQIVTIPPEHPPLVTSDRPLFSSNGLKKKNGQILLPIGPRHCFCAFNDPDVVRDVAAMPAEILVESLRQHIAVRAQAYVYASSGDEAGFVKQWLGYERVPSMGEVLTRDRSQNHGDAEDGDNVVTPAP